MNKLRKYGIILTTIMTIFTSSLIVTKAAGTQATIHTLYKSNTLGNAYEYVVISVEFADYTSGTIIISVENLSFYDYMVFGARLSNVYSSGNTRRLTLQVDDCKQVIVYCLPHAGSMIAISPSIYSNNTAYVEHVNQSFIEEQFTTTNGYIDDLESTCNSIYTDVHNIYLQLVDQALDLDNIQSQLTSIGNYLNTTNTSLTTLNNSVSLIMQQIQQIDYQIDTITWNSFASGLLGFTDNLSTYTTNTGSHSEQYMVYNAPSPDSWTKNAPCIYKVTAPIGNRVIKGINFYALYNGALRSFNPKYYYFNMRNSIEIYIIYDSYLENPTQKMNLVLEFITTQGNVYNYGTSVSPFEITYIPSTDIEYWKLLQYFEQYKYQTEQLNMTQELIDIVSQLSSGNSTETTTNITNFNTNMETINNIENNLSVAFDTSKDNFDTQNENNWIIDSNLLTSARNFQTVFTNMLGYCEWEGTLLSLILLCAVLLAILG